VALYIPASKRRRQTIILAVATLLIGLAVGAFACRASAPSVDDRVHDVQEDARRTASALRVLSLHEESGAVSNQLPGDGGADLVLQRTRTELEGEFGDAPWLGERARRALLDELTALEAQPDRNTPAFASAANALAAHIAATFGVG
jgi:hypothetical protein